MGLDTNFSKRVLNVQLENWDKSVDQFLDHIQTPCFIYDLSIVKGNLLRFLRFFPEVRVFYSVKTNPMTEVLSVLIASNCSFDVATIGEIRLLLRLGAKSDRLLYTHPIKLEDEVTESVRLGIRYFTFDTLEELVLLNKLALGKSFFLRVLPPVEGSFYPYSDKFGASGDELEKILTYSINNQIPIEGISFHVGSQTLSIKPWRETIRFCSEVFRKFYGRVPKFNVLNIGSGFPYKYGSTKCVTLEEISELVIRSKGLFPRGVEFWAEPGRVLVANSAFIVSTIVKNVQRRNTRWLYTDAGVYHGLIEILESRGRLQYKVEAFKKGKLVTYNIAGKTLDPDDTLGFNVLLPESLVSGDKIVIRDVGAYTSSFYSEYHSIPRPFYYFIDKDLK